VSNYYVEYDHSSSVLEVFLQPTASTYSSGMELTFSP